MSVSLPRLDRGAASPGTLWRFTPASSANWASLARSAESPRPSRAKSRSIDFSSTEIAGGGAGMDAALGGTLGSTFVPAFTGGGADFMAGKGGGDGTFSADAAGGGDDGATAGGGGIEGNFGGPGTGGKAFV
jgi:hypothetical protein